MTVCGPAVTVQAKPFNNINIHRAIYAAEPGDVVRGDRDGVVAIPRTRLAEAIAASEARENKEAGIIAELKEGNRTLDLHGWSGDPLAT